jgi:HipA-like C-terminal domain
MNTSRDLPRALVALLRERSPRSAAEMMGATGASQPTVSRALAALGPQVVRIGRARATRYALARDVARAGSSWPLYRITAAGSSQHLGRLTALHADGFHVEATHAIPALLHPPLDGLFPGLPWFLDDLRPQGFLGRVFARRVAADLGASSDPTRWQADDVVLALLRHGDDGIGDLVLGEAALQTALQRSLAPPAVNTEADFPHLTQQALNGELVGSSAGGEQPKFLTRLADEGPVIVKFSDRRDTPTGERWADLLRCEQIAGEVLREHGVPAARSRIVESDGRVFLVSQRFDRTPQGGRRGFVSLASVDAAFYGHGRIDWWRWAPQLASDGWITDGDARRLRMLSLFGELIGNNDMHLGNAGLVLTDETPFALAPAYDMLPMRFRPSAGGEVVERSTVVSVLPTPEMQADWIIAAQAADQFWRQVSVAPAMSRSFTALAEAMHVALRTAIERFA